MRRSTAAALAALLVVTTVALLGATAAPAAAAEVYTVPASRVFDVDGRGWGHGRGMSQWGAQGAAVRGVPSSAILDAYYRGTAATPAPEQLWLRVALTRSGAEGRPPAGSPSSDRRYECDASGPYFCELEVLPAPGLRVRNGGGPDQSLPAEVPVPGGSARAESWAVVNEPAGLVLRAWAAGAWRGYVLDGSFWNPGPLLLSAPGPLVVQHEDFSWREYRGVLQAVRTSSTTMARINHVPREEYLRGVVPKEMPPSWRPAALEAQAVAARSYAENYRRSRPAGAVWDICDSTSCQVYAGSRAGPQFGPLVSQEAASTDAAIAATRDIVRTYEGSVIRSEFSSSNGGWTAAGGQPWLPAQADGWDGTAGNPHNRWTGRLPASALESRFPAVGRLSAVAVLSRDGNGEWGGRVLDVELRGVAADGTATAVRTTGEAIRSAYAYSGGNPSGIRSSWWFLRGGTPLLSGAWAGDDGAWLSWARPDGAVEVGRWPAGGALLDRASLGGVVRGGPAVAGRASGWREVFARGGDDALWVNRRSPDGVWQGWQSLGGRLASAPAVASVDDEVTLVVVGGDGQLWHRWSWASGAWSGWTPIGGAVRAGTSPSTAYVARDRLDVVVMGTDGAAWRQSWQGSWRGWGSLGGVLVDGVTAASAGGELTAALRGRDSAVWTRTDSVNWTTLGGQVLGPPAATGRLGSGRVDVFAVGADGGFWATTRTGGGWSGWRPLG